ncbi:M23 family metallopeptidase [Bacillus cereus]|uniref:M23ase beta-sheet core domain-containing protein n=1 Tax=Bacillus cereus TaxID=1396 RepID=A0A2B9M5R6_BACCE|nr:M23 family metallopeptidase [Bacillus cereus]PET94280.1 hypothetical protein CN527_27630 [Bacillus cereus]PEZ83101.1 hypothetical protein CN374_29310 [Bacillus cereus]PFU44488.1 hypothetical protein COK86_08500 [Bacillus cereus]PGN92730.1 hypothetical protein CN976_23435 [Bacillus cereus]
MPFQYQRNPFNTTEQVKMYYGCHEIGAKDFGFDSMEDFGTQVFAVESGTVVFINRDSHCFSRQTPSPNDDKNLWELYDSNDNNKQLLTFYRNNDESVRKAIIDAPEMCQPNEIVVRGSDNYFTSYVHVLPDNDLAVGSEIQIGDSLGKVDRSGIVTGPHVHFERIIPNPDFDPINPDNSPFWINGGTCNWTMFTVADITPTPQDNDWVEDEDSGNWYAYINGTRQRNRFVTLNKTDWFLVDENGVYTGSYYSFDKIKNYYRLWWDPKQKWYKWVNSKWVLE